MPSHLHRSIPSVGFSCWLEILPFPHVSTSSVWNLQPVCHWNCSGKATAPLSSLNPAESSQNVTILTMFLKRSSAIPSAPCTFIFPKLSCLLVKIQFFSINWWSPYLNHDLKSLFTATYSTVHWLFGKIKQALEKTVWYIQIKLIFLYSFKTISSFIVFLFVCFLLKSVISSPFDL